MLRPLSAPDLSALRRAASADDRTLDQALMRAGILPPADLDEIRSYLRHPATRMHPRTNHHGHVEIDVIDDDRAVARILNDGQVRTLVA